MKVLVAGDFCPVKRYVSVFERKQFLSVFSEIRELTENVDYSIVNLECPVVIGGEKPIEKIGPNLKSTVEGLDAIKWTGFNCVTLANNHFLDYGEMGVSETLHVCGENNIDVVGGGLKLEDASKILFKQIKGRTLAIINCCEHEFSIAGNNSAGSNPLNPIQQFYAIKEARKKADFVLVIVHGGHEHYNLPSPRMQKTYRFFIDSGADAVVNHHQHCYSGYEFYHNKPIFYGLGNFCFDKLYDGIPATWYKGYLVELEFGKSIDVGYKLIPYYQSKESTMVKLMQGEDYMSFYEDIKSLNSIISDSIEIENRHIEWMEKYGRSFELQFLPYNNRWLISAYIRNLFPSFLSRKKLLGIKNHLECESHMELSLFAINKLLNKLR